MKLEIYGFGILGQRDHPIHMRALITSHDFLTVMHRRRDLLSSGKLNFIRFCAASHFSLS